MPLLTTRLCFFVLWFLAMIGTLMVGDPESSFALDSLPRSPRVGSLRIPLLTYNRVPISKLLSNPTSYHLREVRIAGTVRTVETQLMTRGCGKPYELTVISLEDESGVVDVLDQGACGRNTSAVRAPTLAAGDRVDLLVHVVGGIDGLGGSLEAFALWIERAQD
ncbi:MAG: hypothetical protein L0Z46_00925 [Nitrospiraceae bacterium]|nr:hypothetical protein [Nitrospiraceae bacterium]